MSGPDLKTRQAVVARDGGLCVACGRAVAIVHDDGTYHPVAMMSLHHRRLRGMGGRSVDHTAPNLVTACGSGTTGCHGRMHADPAWARSRGYIVPTGPDTPEMVPLIVAVAPGEDCVMVLDGDTRSRVYPLPGDAA